MITHIWVTTFISSGPQHLYNTRRSKSPHFHPPLSRRRSDTRHRGNIAKEFGRSKAGVQGGRHLCGTVEIGWSRGLLRVRGPLSIRNLGNGERE